MIHGTLFFPGLQFVREFTFTLTQGITPSVCQVSIVPQYGLTDLEGTLIIGDGQEEMSFPGCVVDSATLVRNQQGLICHINILDRRWRWKFGEIWGRYNIRTASGNVDPATQKTPQQLARLLFTSMNESGYNVSQMPNDILPEVDWVASNPAYELQSLAEMVGCRVVMNTTGQVGIYPVGYGADLPDIPQASAKVFGIDPQDVPSGLKLICGPERFQTTFVLEAVGQEPDKLMNGIKIESGDTKKIDDLSYKPSAGWGTEFPESMGNIVANGQGTDDECRAKAQQTVYSWYRIAGTADRGAGGWNIQGLTAVENGGSSVIPSVTSLWQLLPVENGLVETYIVDYVETPLPAKLEGMWDDNSCDDKNNANVRAWKESFSIDQERGIVMLSRPAYKFASSGTSIEPAQLWLTVAHPVKMPDTTQPIRTTFYQTIPGADSSTGPMIVRRDELRRRFIGNYKVSGTTWTAASSSQDTQDSIGEIRKEADYYLRATMDAFEPRQTAQGEYTGFIDISPDGAICQVTWTMGPGGARTIASRNSEHDPYVPNYQERVQNIREKANAYYLRAIQQKMNRAPLADNHINLVR